MARTHHAIAKRVSLRKTPLRDNPENNAGNATGIITLYFTQADFDEFNALPFNGPHLPEDPDDDAGRLNFAIYQYTKGKYWR